MIRSILFWSHLIVGLSAGMVILILCLTGAIIAFEHQLVDLMEQNESAAAPSSTTPLLPVDSLLTSARQVESDKVTTIEWFANPQMPVRIRFANQQQVLLNGYSGEVLGRGAVATRAFMRWNTMLHTSLLAQAAGHWIVGVSNIGMVFLVATGAWLWWPRHWHWKALRNSVAFRLDLHGKARDWNWHNALGLWFFVPLAIVSLTGIVLSFGAVDRWWKEFASANLLSPAQPVTKVARSDPAPDPQGALPWMSAVQQRFPAWRSIVLGGAGAPNAEGLLSLTIHKGMPRHRLASCSIKVDAKTNQIVSESNWSNEDPKNRARAIARVGHSGELIGIWGQALAFVTCLAGLVMIYTGFALSWRRFMPRPKPRPAATR